MKQGSDQDAEVARIPETSGQNFRNHSAQAERATAFSCAWPRSGQWVRADATGPPQMAHGEAISCERLRARREARLFTSWITVVRNDNSIIGRPSRAGRASATPTPRSR